eukprot:200845-Pleurochrysis_carterae.AAC.1
MASSPPACMPAPCARSASPCCCAREVRASGSVRYPTSAVFQECLSSLEDFLGSFRGLFLCFADGGCRSWSVRGLTELRFRN